MEAPVVTEEQITARIERLPISGWYARVISTVASANFFDAFDSLTIAFVLPVLVGVWHITLCACLEPFLVLLVPLDPRIGSRRRSSGRRDLYERVHQGAISRPPYYGVAVHVRRRHRGDVRDCGIDCTGIRLAVDVSAGRDPGGASYGQAEQLHRSLRHWSLG
jgi:hypothetical protein